MASIIRSALRTQAAWDSMAPGDQARFDYHFELMSSWESAIPADLVAEDEQWILECFNDWTGPLSDTVNIISRNTSALNNIVITSPDGIPPPITVPPSGFSIRSPDFNAITLLVSSAYSEVKNIGIEISGSGSRPEGLSIGADSISVHNNYIYAGSSSNILIAREVAVTGAKVYLNVMYGGEPLYFFSAISLFCNTIVSMIGPVDLAGSFAEYLVHNNAMYSPGVVCFTSRSDSLTETHNAASDDSVDAVDSIQNITGAEFVDADNGDYHLADGSQLIGAGLNVIEGGHLPSPQFDIEGTQLPDTGPWNIGAYGESGGEPPEPGGDKLLIGVSPADAIQVGDSPVDRVMVGLDLVWPEP